MELALILGIVLVVAVLATGVGFTLSRRSLRRQEEAESDAVDRARPSRPRTGMPDIAQAPEGASFSEIDITEDAAFELEIDAELEGLDLGAGFELEAEPAPGGSEADAGAGPELDLSTPSARPRLRDRLGKARALLAGYVGDMRHRDKIDDDVWDELEEALILADVGVRSTQQILDDLRRRVKETGASTPTQLIELLKTDLVEFLASADRALVLAPGELNVWMFVGVNGVGKTTTIGKLGQREQANGRAIVMAAGDTFRAAAAEQLELWSKRVGADLVRGQEGADPGSVLFDAMGAAQNRGADLVLVDTAGRLHTKVNLMEELKKLRRIVDRTPGALKEVLLVIDATTGQNGLVQAKQFS